MSKNIHISQSYLVTALGNAYNRALWLQIFLKEHNPKIVQSQVIHNTVTDAFTQLDHIPLELDKNICMTQLDNNKKLSTSFRS